MGAVVDAKQLLGVHVLMFTHTQVCSSFAAHGPTTLAAHLNSSLPSSDDANDPR